MKFFGQSNKSFRPLLNLPWAQAAAPTGVQRSMIKMFDQKVRHSQISLEKRNLRWNFSTIRRIFRTYPGLRNKIFGQNRNRPKNLRTRGRWRESETWSTTKVRRRRRRRRRRTASSCRQRRRRSSRWRWWLGACLTSCICQTSVQRCSQRINTEHWWLLVVYFSLRPSSATNSPKNLECLRFSRNLVRAMLRLILF